MYVVAPTLIYLLGNRCLRIVLPEYNSARMSSADQNSISVLRVECPKMYHDSHTVVELAKYVKKNNDVHHHTLTTVCKIDFRTIKLLSQSLIVF